MYTVAVPVPVIAAPLSASLTRNQYGVLAAIYVLDVAAAGAVSNATKHAAVAVTITVCICVANADVNVLPLLVVADNVCVVNGCQTLLISIMSLTYMLVGATLKYLWSGLFIYAASSLESLEIAPLVSCIHSSHIFVGIEAA